MKRRRLVALILAAATLVLPCAGRAQPPRVPVIGLLSLGTPEPAPFVKGIRDGLAELGYAEGRTIRYEIRSADGNAGLLAGQAAELVRLNVDVIVTFQTPAAAAAKQATGEIPVVMAPAGDPVGTGLIESLARPGGNVTGVSAATAEVAGKSVELLRELLPAARRVAVLANETDPFAQPFLAEIGRATETLGMTMQPLMTQPGQPLDPVFDALAGKLPDALIIQGSLSRREVVEVAMKHRLPIFSSNQLLGQMGGMVTYAASQADMYRRAAGYVDRIVKGAKASDLPVQLPTKFDLLINLKTAQALGIEISPLLLARADQVFE
jgi:putative ABC transport system substrate-binding protein